MSADPVFDHHLKNAILARLERFRFEDGCPYDARCSTVAALEAQFGWKRACAGSIAGTSSPLVVSSMPLPISLSRAGWVTWSSLKPLTPIPEPISPRRWGGRSPCENRRRRSNSSQLEMAEMGPAIHGGG
jgi:hypothetical protein